MVWLLLKTATHDSCCAIVTTWHFLATIAIGFKHVSKSYEIVHVVHDNHKLRLALQNTFFKYRNDLCTWVVLWGPVLHLISLPQFIHNNDNNNNNNNNNYYYYYYYYYYDFSIFAFIHNQDNWMGSRNKAPSDTWCNVKFSCFTSKYTAIWNENLAVNQMSLRAFFHAPLQCMEASTLEVWTSQAFLPHIILCILYVNVLLVSFNSSETN